MKLEPAGGGGRGPERPRVDLSTDHRFSFGAELVQRDTNSGHIKFSRTANALLINFC